MQRCCREVVSSAAMAWWRAERKRGRYNVGVCFVDKVRPLSPLRWLSECRRRCDGVPGGQSVNRQWHTVRIEPTTIVHIFAISCHIQVLHLGDPRQ